MNKKRKLDFVLYEDKDMKMIFRFYPRQSHCHSFNDDPPSNWDEVYKVYYAYSIILQCKEDNCSKVVFDSGLDECSIIDEVAARIIYILQGKEYVNIEDDEIQLLDSEIFLCGYGVSWKINSCRKPGNYEFNLWNWRNCGYRFWLDDNRAAEFGNFLHECCEYMLEHGEPI